MMKFSARDRIPTDRRPLGYWLAAIDGPLRDTMRGAFETFGVSRREWRTLTTLHRGAATVAEVEAALPRPHDSDRAARPKGKSRRTIEQLLDGFVDRGWAARDDVSYELTAEGERVHDAVLKNVQMVRASVTDGISDDDYATTMSTLERIARNVGWVPAGGTAGRGRESA